MSTTHTVQPVRICDCDFCTGAKNWNDNWCSHCGEVKLREPRWWENMDACDLCDLSARQR